MSGAKPELTDALRERVMGVLGHELVSFRGIVAETLLDTPTCRRLLQSMQSRGEVQSFSLKRPRACRKGGRWVAFRVRKRSVTVYGAVSAIGLRASEADIRQEVKERMLERADSGKPW